MRPSRPFVALLILALLAPLVSAAPPTQTSQADLPNAADFATPAFNALWARTDQLVAQGAVARSWVWGPTPGAQFAEPYKEGPHGQRTVQYFDKARMEVNRAAAPDSSWAVTTGLLVTELVSGQV